MRGYFVAVLVGFLLMLLFHRNYTIRQRRISSSVRIHQNLTKTVRPNSIVTVDYIPHINARDPQTQLLRMQNLSQDGFWYGTYILVIMYPMYFLIRMRRDLTHCRNIGAVAEPQNFAVALGKYFHNYILPSV